MSIERSEIAQKPGGFIASSINFVRPAHSELFFNRSGEAEVITISDPDTIRIMRMDYDSAEEETQEYTKDTMNYGKLIYMNESHIVAFSWKPKEISDDWNLS